MTGKLSYIALQLVITCHENNISNIKHYLNWFYGVYRVE